MDSLSPLQGTIYFHLRKILAEMRLKHLMLLAWAVMMVACVKPPNYPDSPTLEFRNFSKTELRQGAFGEDSVVLTLFFTDGDGDFGSASNSIERNIFMRDNRTGQTFREYKAPFVPEEGAGNGISGTIDIVILTTCCVFDLATGIPPCEKPAAFPTNTLTLDIFIKDRAGNQSNTITTPPLTLRCN
jgi:hypothetical protein